MLNDSDILFFDEEEVLTFAENDEATPKTEYKKWKLMIVDDEYEVHNVTKMVLSKFEFEGRGLEFISCFSGKQAQQAIKDNEDTAVILLDVVMEQDDSGLQLAKFIREEVKNNIVRIILRTGQPGQAPEEKVVVQYDINDYKEKTELTSQKLFTTLISALRTYRDLKTSDSNRKSLRKIIGSFSEIFDQDSIKEFGECVLNKFKSILSPDGRVENEKISGFIAVKCNNGSFCILSATGVYSKDEGNYIEEVLKEDILNDLRKVYETKKNIYYQDKLFIYLKSKSGMESLMCFEGYENFSRLDRDLIDVFCINISAVNEAIINAGQYESERQQHMYSEKLRELNKSLTSTLDIYEVFERLLDNLSEALRYNCGFVATMDEGEIIVLSQTVGWVYEDDSGSGISKYYKSIVDSVQNTGQPILIQDEDEMKSLVSVPVLYQERVYAVIVVERDFQDKFDEKDKDLVFTFASQAGIALANAQLFSEIKDRNVAIENILNNAGQGFLTFGEDICIDEEYSAECLRIFGKRIENLKFSRLIHHDSEKIYYLEKILSKILMEENITKRNLYIPLLPDEIYVNDKYINIAYKVIDGRYGSDEMLFMVILTDITEKRSLENEMEKERKVLRMVVSAVVNFSDIMRSIDDYRIFANRKVYDIINSGIPISDIFNEIFRCVHTFKGTFAHLDMVNLTNELHCLETKLADFILELNEWTPSQLNEYILGLNMGEWLEKDLCILKETLGEQYFEQEKTIFIDLTKLLNIEKKVFELLPPEKSSIILTELRKLRYKPFKELLKSYGEYLKKLSERFEKPVEPLEIEGWEIQVDTDKYNPFAKSLIHIFRNIIDHGIENIEDRIKAGKDENAKITCRIQNLGNYIKFTITDDGRGIDAQALRKASVRLGLFDEKAVSAVPDTDVLNLVFRDGFSTKSQVTEFSGRGYGLAAVKNEVDKLGGRIEINTRYGEGTEFCFLLPYEL